YGEDSWLKGECRAISYYPPHGRELRREDMVDVTSLEEGGGTLGTTTIRFEAEQFRFYEGEQVIAAVPSSIIHPPMPMTVAPPRPLLRQELTLQFIGGSDGFDPA